MIFDPILIRPQLLKFKLFIGLNGVPTAPPNVIAPPVVVPDVFPCDQLQMNKVVVEPALLIAAGKENGAARGIVACIRSVANRIANNDNRPIHCNCSAAARRSCDDLEVRDSNPRR